jgi:hypothetical protein
MQHPFQLRFLFTRDTYTNRYTALKMGRRSETGREKRVMPEFGEYGRRKKSTPKFRALQVSSIGGRTQTDRFCSSAKVQIRGIEFPIDLIVLGNQDATIDVILGMNWLT